MANVGFMSTEAQDLRSQLAAQQAVAQILTEAGDLAEATPKLLRAIGETLGWELGALWEADADLHAVSCIQTWRSPTVVGLEDFEQLSRKVTLARGLGLPGRVVASGDPQWIADVIGDEDFQRTQAAAAAGLHGAIAFPIQGSSGTLGVIEFFAGNVRPPDQGVLETMSAFGRQIGQYMERTRAEEAVRESEARKSAMLESALECVIAMDHQGRILDFNPAAERTFGYPQDQALGREMAQLIIPPSLRERHRQGLARYLKTGEGPLLDSRVEITGMRADGSEFPVELTVTRIALEGPPTFTGYLRDVSQRRREERAQTFLSESSRLLAASLDYQTTLQSVAGLAVPGIADWCAVDVLERRGVIRNVAIKHAEPQKVELAEELMRRYPRDADSPHGAAQVIRTGASEHHPHISDDLLAATARDSEHLELMRGLGLYSAIVVPMMARGRTLGAITLVAAESRRSLDEHDLQLAEELGRRAGVAVDNARLYSERSHIARTLQESLLPAELPQIPGLEVAARYRAVGEANEVGGDFYDMFESADSEWVVVAGDVSGKGARAAAITALARYTVRAAALHEREPSRVLGRLNDAMAHQRSPEEFCTVAYLRLRPGRGPMDANRPPTEVTVARGGHPPPVVLRATGGLESVATTGIPLGVLPDPEIEDQALDLQPGDAIVLYSDGVTEARLRSGRLFGTERLMALIESCRGHAAAHIAERIDRAVLEAQDGEPRDDISIVVVRALPPTNER